MTDPHQTRLRRLARLIQRAPWTIQLLQILYRRFAAPWVTAGALGAVYNEQGQLLIVEHVFHPTHPWGLPGGWMNRRESPAQTIAREILEETALIVIVEKPLAISTTDYLPNHLDIAFLCRAQPGNIRLSSELMGYRWIGKDDPPPPMYAFHQTVFAAAWAELG